MQRLTGLRALVTGGERGYGAFIARELAREGAAVAVHASARRHEAELVAGEIAAAGGRAVGLSGHLGDQAEVEAVFSTAIAALGGLDLVVNHAGMSEEELLTLVLTAQEAARRFGPAGGAIVNLSGRTLGGPVEVLTRSLARELRPRGIRVNAIQTGAPADPAAVADAAVFLASLQSGEMTGETLALAAETRH